MRSEAKVLAALLSVVDPALAVLINSYIWILRNLPVGSELRQRAQPMLVEMRIVIARELELPEETIQNAAEAVAAKR